MRKAIKKTIILACCAMYFTASLTGCGKTPPDSSRSNTTEVSTSTSEKESSQKETAGKIFGDVASIKLSDPSDGIYEEDLDIELTPEEVASFLDISLETVSPEKPHGSRDYYKMDLYDKSGNLIDSLEIDMSWIYSNSGTIYRKEGNIKSWIDTINNNHGTNINFLWGRTPSSKYLSQIDSAASGYIQEWQETNFDDVLEIDLTTDDIAKFKSSLQSSTISKKPVQLERYKYTIEFFTDTGASIYVLHVTESGEIYSEFGYEITGDEISSTIQEIIDQHSSN